MSFTVFAAVLASALIHATWNALIKADGDRLAGLVAMSATQIVLSLILLANAPPLAVEAWPFILGSGILSTAYLIVLQHAYRSGDFSQVYPLARGTAPLIVAAVSVTALGETLSLGAKIAILLISAGIASLALARRKGDIKRNKAPILWALFAGCIIGCYTLVDGIGVRVAGNVDGYMAWMMLLTASLTVISATLLRGARTPWPPLRSLRMGAAAGALSFASAWVVMWAMANAPLALVSALRETGIVFAAIIAVTVMKEKLDLARAASIASTLTGTALLKLVR